MRTPDRTLLAGALLALGFLSSGAGPAVAAPVQDTLRVVFASNMFTAVNRSDALASGKVWIETVGRRRGINLEVMVNSYDSTEDLRATLRRRSADLFILRSVDYLALGKDQAKLDLLFAPQVGGTTMRDYLLLMRRDRRVSLADLRGKNILLLKTGGASLPRPWMEGLLRSAGLGSLKSFSPTSREVDKASAAILPVFFGNADACVVDSRSFELMKELNPQIGISLEICQRSPLYLETVICVRRDYSAQRANLIAGLTDLHEDAAGRQILMVFKIDRVVPFDKRALQSLITMPSADRLTLGGASR